MIVLNSLQFKPFHQLRRPGCVDWFGNSYDNLFRKSIIKQNDAVEYRDN